MDGLELLEKARRLQPEIESMVITGHGEIETAIEAMQLGAANHFRKPIDFVELALTIARCMEKIRLGKTIRESEEKYRQLFAGSYDAIMIFAADTKRFVDVNEAALAL